MFSHGLMDIQTERPVIEELLLLKIKNMYETMRKINVVVAQS